MKVISRFYRGITKNWQGTLIVAAIGLLIGWLKAFGIQAAFLIPLSYISGALAGIDDGSFWGGIIGKTIVMLFMNGFLTTLIIHKGKLRDKFKTAA